MAVIGRVLLIPKGDYSGSTTYNMLDWVRYNGSAWVCTTDGTVGTVPASGVTEWALLAQDGSVSGSIAWASITGKPFDNFDTDDFDTDANSNLIIKRGTFGSITIGSDTLEATGDDEIELVAGTNITLSVDDTTTPSTITITASGGSAVGNLSDLSDVTLTTPTSGQILKYDGSEWINDTAPSGGASNLSDLSDTTISSPTDDQFLRYDSSSSKWVNESVTIPSQPTITMNGSTTTTPSFYAPTSAGTSGYYLKSNGSGAPSWASVKQGPTVLTSSTISASATTYTFSNSAITTSSVIDVYDTIFGFSPTNISVSSGSCAITFPAQSSTHTIKLLVY